ncbi:MAG TPA: hypothetical protein VFZ53_17330 [Polyangiaceae bacterium]
MTQGRFGATAGMLLALSLCLGGLSACAGKSISHGGGGDGDSGDSGDDGGFSGGRSGLGGSGGTAGGGTAGTSGQGGSSRGGAPTSMLVRPIPRHGVDKVDLLFMIDNSISMADKQRLLAEAVPVLMQRLVDPFCVDENGNATSGTASTGCAAGTPEFEPVEDIHIGIVTSSLGNHGGDVCVLAPSDDPPRALNDAAQLLPTVRSGLYSYQNQGFLLWDPRTERPSPDPHPDRSSHETNADDFVENFTNHIVAAGERGCGYESSLEAWYRFLIDPEPVSQITVNNNVSARGPINEIVLRQRASFLRPDSLLAIVMLTDENDCSINDENGQQGWLVGRRIPMPRGSDACGHPEDPNVYRCCIPCVLLDVPDFPAPQGCRYDADVACNAGHSLSPAEDSTNLRCYDQKRRFGLELLYPWQRYVDALTAPRIALRDPGPSGTTEVTNPIYTPGADGTPARSPALVILAGIVGVPWQDLADEASLTGRGLRYLDAAGLHGATPNRWDVILGDPDVGVPPLDPLMIESVDPRPLGAEHPLLGAAARIAAPTSAGLPNAINGSEQATNGDDLQYACIFDIEPDVPCTMANQDGCDCNASESSYARPTCDYSGGGDGVQTHAKAYPAVRQLQVLKALGDNAVVTSICPKNTRAEGTLTSDPDYGYNPAASALVRRFHDVLGLPCLPRPLPLDSDGSLACTVVEARLETNGCSCDPSARSGPASSSAREAIEDELAFRGFCGGPTGVECSSYCLCEIPELVGAQAGACRSSLEEAATGDGYCYVEPDRGVGSPALVSHCPSAERQLIRFVGTGAPAERAQAFVTCDGEPI